MQVGLQAAPLDRRRDGVDLVSSADASHARGRCSLAPRRSQRFESWTVLLGVQRADLRRSELRQLSNDGIDPGDLVRGPLRPRATAAAQQVS